MKQARKQFALRQVTRGTHQNHDLRVSGANAHWNLRQFIHPQHIIAGLRPRHLILTVSNRARQVTCGDTLHLLDSGEGRTFHLAGLESDEFPQQRNHPDDDQNHGNAAGQKPQERDGSCQQVRLPGRPCLTGQLLLPLGQWSRRPPPQKPNDRHCHVNKTRTFLKTANRRAAVAGCLAARASGWTGNGNNTGCRNDRSSFGAHKRQMSFPRRSWTPSHLRLVPGLPHGRREAPGTGERLRSLHPPSSRQSSPPSSRTRLRPPGQSPDVVL